MVLVRSKSELELGSMLVLVLARSKRVLVQGLGSILELELVLGSILEPVLGNKLVLELVRSMLVLVHSNRSLPCGSRTNQLRW